MSHSIIVDETEEDRSFPPELLTEFFKPWASDASDEPATDDGGNEVVDSLTSSIDVLSVSSAASSDGSPERLANAELPRPIDDKYYAVFVGRKIGVMAHLWEAKAAIRGIDGGLYISYATRDDAAKNFDAAKAQGVTVLVQNSALKPHGKALRPTFPALVTRHHKISRPHPSPSPAKPSQSLSRVAPDKPQPVAGPSGIPPPRMAVGPLGFGPLITQENAHFLTYEKVSEDTREPTRGPRPSWISAHIPHRIQECHRFEQYGVAYASKDWNGYRAYAVIRGTRPGIYETEAECHAVVKGVPFSYHKAFSSYRNAVTFFLIAYYDRRVYFVYSE
ncbi:hypothetical protein BV25DRAFT_1922159 [Artomyces pyxidatus]|uniref:Uncharacterized protein n=1 Tax=Artomyces pyxidatus TaxID=48021 RepID=A0ACB8SFJ1_9AGAM|nr:hypothetical protein BV25DRAFT_1922159 [Artomyces pyxidatus]